MLIKKLTFLLNVIICYFPERPKTKHILLQTLACRKYLHFCDFLLKLTNKVKDSKTDETRKCIL